MLREAIDKIIDLAAPNFKEIDGRVYSDKPLDIINEELRATDRIHLNTLTGLIDYIRSEVDLNKGKYFINITSPTSIELVSQLNKDRKREYLASVEAEIPEFKFGTFINNEEFIIGVQAKFVDDDSITNEKPIILKFAGNIKSGTVAEYGDTGVGQKAALKKGVSSMQEVEVPSPCTLIPYRTFTEVEQPASSFIFRVKDDEIRGVSCALFEADGGAWKNEAKLRIKDFLSKELAAYFKSIVILS